MRRLLTGCFVTLLLLLNTLILIGPLLVFALLKLVAPGRWRDYASGAVMWIAETWAEIDKLIFRLCIPTQWDIRGGENLRGDTSYLVVSNHQSWVGYSGADPDPQPAHAVLQILPQERADLGVRFWGWRGGRWITRS